MSLSSNAQQQVHVAVGIVHNTMGQVLYAQRPEGKPYAGWWEFPGGKLEKDETVVMALARELREELGIQILDCHHWLSHQYVYPHAHVNLQFCHVRQFKGQPNALEGQAFKWGDLEHPPLPFLPAALPVLKSMRLPPVLRFTSAHAQGFDAWKARLLTADHGIDEGLVIVQEPDESQLTQVFEACLIWKSNAPKARRVLVSSRHPKPLWGMADGVFLDSNHLDVATHKPSCQWVGAMVNNPHSMSKAAALGCDFGVFTHHEPADMTSLSRAKTSWGQLGQVLANSPIAVYPLLSATIHGEHDLPLAFAAGAAGIALS